MNRNWGLTVAGAAALLICVGAAGAQDSPRIVIENAPGKVVPLDAGSTVRILSNGDLSVRCRTDGCPEIGGSDGGSGTNPPVAFALAPATATSVVAGANNLTLSWTSNDSDACFGVAPSGIDNWSGRHLPRTGSQPLSLSTVTDGNPHIFQLRCYNQGGSRSASSGAITVTQPPQAVGYCSEYYDGVVRAVPAHPAFKGYTLTPTNRTFFEVFGVQAGAGSSTNKFVPGNFTSPAAGKYLAIEFSLSEAEGSGAQFRVDWIDSGSLGPGGSITATVSPCPGDFRARATGSTDAYLNSQCRPSVSNFGGLVVTSVPTQSGCLAPVGKVMYLNIAAYDMYTATPQPQELPATTTCSTGVSTCGVAMKQR
jgi:hypothetical protein